MLKKRLVPKLLIRHRQVGATMRPVLVTTRGFAESIEVGDPVSQAKIYEAQMADELIVLNIEGTPIAGNTMMLDLIARLASETFMPLTVGGGVRSAADFATLLASGADKVAINQAALDRPALIAEAAVRYGAQVVVVSIDYRIVDGRPQVFTHSGAEPTGLTPLDWARRATDEGAGEILLTNADRDGTGAGLDIPVGAEIAAALPIPVILSGGCGLAAHFSDGFLTGGAEAVAAGTYFCFRDQNPFQTRSQIRNAGIAIRMEI